MKAFITGATGLIGGLLAKKLYEKGDEVVVFRRVNSDTKEIDNLPFQHYIGDITDPSSLEGTMKDCEVVYHSAGLVVQWSGYKKSLFKINLNGTQNILNAALDQGVKRVVLVSSIASIGGTCQPEIIDESYPFNLGHLPYALSKWEMEVVARSYMRKGLEVIIVNPATTFGPADKHMNAGRLIINVKKGKMFGFPPGGNNVVDADDVVDGMIAAMDRGRNGERYILGNENLSYKSILETVSEVSNTNPPKTPLPKWFLYAGGWGNELFSKLLNRELYPSLQAINMSMKFMYFSCDKARRELDYEPKVDFKTSVHKALNWYNENSF
jgi:dihydroflavonol-4-reductase